MFHVASENLIPLLVGLLVGFIIGLWIWKFARNRDESAPILSEDDPLRRPYVAAREPDPPLTFPTDDVDGGLLSEPIVSGPAAGEAMAGMEAGPDGGDDDDFQAMKGVGPKLAAMLRAEGLARYSDIAALTSGDLERLDARLGAFKGRLGRDRVVEQARLLASGEREAYEREFGRL